MNPLDLLRKLRARAATLVRRAWTKVARDGMTEADSRRSIELMYARRDPWKMESPKEQFRFVETNRILREELISPAEKVGSILEIGCGEGHQSQHLSELCDDLTGIDVAAAAIERARARVPAARLIAGELDAQPWAAECQRFDVVTAFEVLYYLDDIPRMLRAMSRLGRACMITYVNPSARVERAVRAMPIAGRRAFSFEDVTWRAAWWRSAARTPGPMTKR